MSQAPLDEFLPSEERPPGEAMAVADGADMPTTVVSEEHGGLPEANGVLELAIIQVNYTVARQESTEEPLIHVFGRTTDGEAVHVTVIGFEPYFYVPTDSLSPEDLDIETITRTETRHTSIRDEPMTRIYARTPRDVGQIRDRFDHYEADVPFPNRFLIDKGIRSGIRVPARHQNGHVVVHHDEVEPTAAFVEPRVHMVDIEVDDRSGFPEDGEEPIVCLTAHDSIRNEYVAWLYVAPDGTGQEPESLQNHELLDGAASLHVNSFSDESAMLADYLSYVEETDPDIISGWNVDDFDAPYILDRLERLDPFTDLDLAIERLSRVDEVWRDNWRGPNIKGRVVFDLLYGYRRTQFTELDSYRLDAVAEEEVGRTKERYTGAIGDLWEQDPERLLEYNVRDVELCVEIDRKQAVIAFWDEVRTFVGCKLEDAPTPGDTVDVYVLQKVHGDFVLPSKGRVEGEDYEGGAVFDPITGVREMVSVLDLKCFSADTEVATPTGLKNIQELSVGDRLYTLNPATFECEIKPVVETHSYQNQFGELHHVTGTTHDFKITENHRFLLATTSDQDWLNSADFTFAEFRDISESEQFAFPRHHPMTGAKRTEFSLVDDIDNGHVVVYFQDGSSEEQNTMPAPVSSALEQEIGSMTTVTRTAAKCRLSIETYREHRDSIDQFADEVFFTDEEKDAEFPLTFSMDEWLEFIGWFVTVGGYHRNQAGIVLHPQNQNDQEQITQLLEVLHINYSVESKRVIIDNRLLSEWFQQHCGVAERTLPDWLFELDACHLQELLQVMTDASDQQISPAERNCLPEDIIRLAIHCGEKPSVSKQSKGTWGVSLDEQGSLEKSTATVEQHDGKVHCVTAKDNHVILAGRNGHLQWIGQSLYPMCMVTINASPETKVNPHVFEDDTYQSPNGTHFRKHPDGIIREMVDELLTEREEKKAERDSYQPSTPEYERFDRQQAAVKVIMNSLYGTLGWERFRLYDRDMGAAVTATGREVLQFTEHSANELGYDVVYGDSVTGDRPIVVRDPQGILRMLPISDLFARASPGTRLPKQALADGGGQAPIQQPKETRQLPGWEALSLSETMAPEWQPITQVIRHRSDKPVVRLQHPVGESQTTTDHSYVANEDGSLVERSPNDLDMPLRVPGVPEVREIDIFDIYTALREQSLNEHQGQTIQADDKWIWLAEPGTSTEETSRMQRHIRLDSEEGYSLLRLLGAFVVAGDLCKEAATNGGPTVTISAADRAWLHRLATDVRALFDGVTATVAESSADTDRRSDTGAGDSWQLRVADELASVFFRRIAGDSTSDKRLPWVVYHAEKRTQDRLLNALARSMGCHLPIPAASPAWNDFEFSTTSRELAAGVSLLLTQRDQDHTLDYAEDSGQYVIHGDPCDPVGTKPILTDTPYDGYVYDLSVEKNQNFVDGVGGIVLHNTDSVMLEIGAESTIANSIDKSFEIQEHINDSYDEFARDSLNAEQHRFQIEFEKLYRRFFQAGKKKRYAGHIVWKEGKDVDDVDITGFEYQRSDIAPITKEVQRHVIDLIVRGDDLDADIDEIATYLSEIIQEFLAGEIKLDAIGIPGGIGKQLDNYETDTAHVRGAKYANELLGTNFARGSKPKRYYLAGVHPAYFRKIEAKRGLDPRRDPIYGEFKRNPDVICVEYAEDIPDEFSIDYEKMLDRTLQGPISRVVAALGLSWDEIKSGQEQTGLGAFY